MKERFEIKQQARDNFKLHYGICVAAFVVFYLLVSALSDINTYSDYLSRLLLLFDMPPIHIAFYDTTSYLIILYALMFFLDPAVTVGYSAFCLRIYRGESAEVGDIFRDGFTGYWRHTGGMLWRLLFTTLWSLLLIIPGIIKSYAYSMTPYILADCPDVAATQALKLSMRMTDGYKGDIFILQLSFIGWNLLSLLTLGILGLVYVGPYYCTTMAGMYEELKRIALQDGIISPEELGLTPPDGALE